MAKHRLLPEPPLRDKLEALAKWAEFCDRQSAIWLRRAVAELLPEDARAQRKAVLRRYARMAYAGRTRTAQARLIAIDWASFRPDDDAPAGSAKEQLLLLVHGGYKPLGYRTILDDLDPTLD